MKHGWILKLSTLTVASLFIGLLIAEGLARSFLPYPVRQIALLRMRAPDLQMDAGTDLKNPNYNPFLQRRPYSEWICDGKRAEQMNNEGFRDRDFVLSKDPTKTRIAILGDSFTEGWMGPRMTAFPRVLESKLGPRFEVLNFGLANRSPLRYLALYHQIVRKYRPDVIMVCLYLNDVDEDIALHSYVTFDAQGIPIHFDYERYFRNTPRMPQTQWEKRLDKWQWVLCRYSRLYPYAAVMLTVDPEFRKRTLKASSPQSFNKNWLSTAQYLETIKKLVEKDGTQYLITYIPDLKDFHALDPLCSYTEHFAVERHIPFFSASKFLTFTNPTSLYIPGDGHFSPAGHRLYADQLASWIKPLISHQVHSAPTFHPTPEF